MSTSDVLNTAAAGASAIAAVASWIVAIRANKVAAEANAAAEQANQAADSANRTAEAVARIERDRWHAELTPEFEITFEVKGNDHGSLDVQLVGPLPLRHLDEIRMEVLPSDDKDRTPRLPGGPSAEDVRNQTWGPYRFIPHTDSADQHGKGPGPFSLEVGRGAPFSLERTRPPLWQEGHDRSERWREEWRGKPIKLRLTCRRDDHEPWVVPYTIEIQGPRVRFM
jgi:hypothetical protein